MKMFSFGIVDMFSSVATAWSLLPTLFPFVVISEVALVGVSSFEAAASAVCRRVRLSDISD